MQNSARFQTTSDFDPEYLRNGSRYPKSENVLIESDSSSVSRKSLVNFGPLTTEYWMWVWTHSNWIFWRLYFSPQLGRYFGYLHQIWYARGHGQPARPQRHLWATTKSKMAAGHHFEKRKIGRFEMFSQNFLRRCMNSAFKATTGLVADAMKTNKSLAIFNSVRFLGAWTLWNWRQWKSGPASQAGLLVMLNWTWTVCRYQYFYYPQFYKFVGYPGTK